MNILSSGSIAMDVVLNSSALPEDDGFALIEKEKMQPGGSSSNVAVSAAGFGMGACQVGKVGNDEMGKRFIQSLEEDGVSPKYMITKENGVTMHTYIVTAPQGKHTIFANLGDCMQDFTHHELPEEILDDIDIYYTGMFSPEVSLYLAQESVRRGKKMMLNMQAVISFMELCGVSLPQFEKAIECCSILVGGRAAYSDIFGKKGGNDVESQLRYAVQHYQIEDGAICTLGSKGAVWYDGNNFIYSEGYSVDPVDTTGAGDCFNGGIMYAFYEKGMSRKESLKFANGAAAIKCLKPGPRSIATEAQVCDFENSKDQNWNF